MICYWDRNRDHATRHGVSESDCEHVLSDASPPYPEHLGSGKYLARGQTPRHVHVQVIFVHESAEEVDFEALTFDELVRLESSKGPYAYVVHARELTDREKRQHRRRRE